jgi:hypothetical protein
MSFFETFFESEEEEKKRLELERRMRRRAEEAAEAAGLEELPTVIDHNAEGHARADAAEAAVATARASARAAAAARAAEIAEAERAAEAAYAAEIAAEIPEAQKARKLLTEYWKKMNEYKARHMNADGLLSNDYSIQANRPNQNWEEVFDACQAAAAAYRYKYEHSQDMEEKKLFEKKFYKYQSYGDDVYMLSMRHHDHDIGMYNVQLGKFPSIWTSNGGKKSKSKYSRKSKSRYSRKY